MRLDRIVAELNLGPERQIITVVIGAVQELALFSHQTQGIWAIAAGIPAFGMVTQQVRQHFHALAHMLALDFFGHVLVVNPAVAMASDLMTQAHEFLCQLGMTLQRHAHPKHGHGQATLLKLVQNPPDTGTRAVFVNGFHGQVTVRVSGRTNNFGQELLGARVTVQDAILAAFLIIQDKLHRNARPIRPLCMGHVFTVTDQVTRVLTQGHTVSV